MSSPFALGAEAVNRRRRERALQQLVNALQAARESPSVPLQHFENQLASAGFLTEDQRKVFEDELSDIRFNRMVQNNPELQRILGASSAEELRTLTGIEKILGERRKRSLEGREIRDVTREEGEITQIVDALTGEITPVEGAEVQRSTQGALDRILSGESLGLSGTFAGQPLDVDVVAGAMGRDFAKQRRRVADSQKNAQEMGLLADRITELVQEGQAGEGGEVVFGTAADVARKLRSFFDQVGGVASVHGIEGVGNINDLLDQISQGSFNASSQYGARVDPIHLMFAVAFAKANFENPRGVTREQIQRALEATEGIRGGSPELILKSLQEILTAQVRQSNLGASEVDLPELDPADVAPRTFGARAKARRGGGEGVSAEVSGGEGGREFFVGTLEDLERAVEEAEAVREEQ